jgi:phosphonate transport system substrate-binding protein
MFVVGLCCTVFYSCQPQAEAHTTVDRPRVLHIGFSPGQEEAEERVRDLAPLTDYLQRALDMQVSLVRTSSYSTIIEAMRADKIDISGMGPFTYVIASEKTRVEPLVAMGDEINGPNFYRSYLITHRNSGILSMDDVVERAGELVLQFVDPASTSGHLIPRSYLMELGLEPEEHFARTIFGMNHTATILTVKSEKVDIAGCASSAMERLLRSGTVAEEDFVILWQSPPIPTSPLVIRANLPTGFKSEVRQAYLNMKTADPAAWKVVTSQYTDSTLIYMATHDSVYAPLRRLAYQIDLLKEKR